MRKISIAICDDERQERESIRNMVEQYGANHEFAIQEFSSADAMLKCTECTWDLVLMDIEMQAPTGFEAACVLARRKPKPLVIFVTKSSTYTTRGYGVAFRYLVKPVDPVEFTQAMDSACEEIAANRFSFRIDNSVFAIPFEDIYYPESFGHLAIVHTADTEYRIRTSLMELWKQLPQSRIAVPHKSYLVNMAYINRATSTEVVLTNGVRIPISRRKRQEFNQAFFRYLGR